MGDALISHTQYADDSAVYVNRQWALGGGGTGAPIHYHNTAWAALVYGAKQWYLYPPHYKIMSNRQILDYVESELEILANYSGYFPSTCTQYAGDVVIVPESWGHGVVNLQDTVAVATEVRSNMFRLNPGLKTLSKTPADNRAGRHFRGN